MNEYLINGQTLTDIADAIRSKTGSVSGLSPAQMASAVTNELVKPSGTKSITSNGTVDVSAYASASVNVPSTPTQSKTLTLGANAPSAVNPDSGKVLSSVPVVLDTSVIKAENIKKDVQMLGITGTHEGGTNYAEHGVFFIDYDGSIIDVWASADAAGKSALPANPSHTGLVAQGWNWDLTHIKSYIADYPDADVYVGQMYRTASGLTEFDITVTKVTGLTVTCNMVGNKNWGDGTSNSATSHTYTNYGSYTVTCDGTGIPSGTSSAGGVFGSTSSNQNRFWCTAVRIGGSVTSFGTYTFYNCYSLKSVTIPQSVTSIGSSGFYNCYGLISVTIPIGITSIGSGETRNCYILKNIALPQGVTAIGSSAFCNCYSLTGITIPQGTTDTGSSGNTFYCCYSLKSVIIPQGVTSIGETMFYRCYGLTKYDFTKATSIPTLSNTNVFDSINGLCKIVVPDALYNSWIAATNWSTHADYIFKASEVE